ncbi:MAG: hypothetical protein EXX96DRAFT_609732 [Benjaminiella poitrasii]|nr:MAG: hypothetical protein EXX96DRAFT_609732 [Benjaminiella poitrasii]
MLFLPFFNTNGTNLNNNLYGLRNYGEVVEIACEVIATNYNNCYVEIFEHLVIIILGIMPCSLSISTMKSVVYDRLLDNVIARPTKPVHIPESTLLDSVENISWITHNRA